MLFLVSPASGAFLVSSLFTVTIQMNGPESLNAIEVYLSWPPNLLEAINVDTSSGAFPIQAEHSLTDGKLTMVRGRIPPEVSGEQSIAQITFRVRAAGDAVVKFDPGCRAIGSGKEVTIETQDGAYRLQIQDTLPPAPPE